MTPHDPDDRFVADVMARTSGPACRQARSLLGGTVDEPMSVADRALVEGHLEHCPECRAVADVFPALVVDLPALAEEAPDAGFTARVLAATSGRPQPRPWRRRWVAWWAEAAARPRFAWEVAYALTLVIVLIVGDPVRAWESAASRFPVLPSPVLDTRLPAPAAVTEAERAVTSRVDAAYRWLERRTDAVTVLLSTLRGDETTRSSAWYAMADVTNRWVRRALSWARPLVDVFRPTPAEPTGEPMRSSNQTETHK